MTLALFLAQRADETTRYGLKGAIFLGLAVLALIVIAIWWLRR